MRWCPSTALVSVSERGSWLHPLTPQALTEKLSSAPITRFQPGKDKAAAESSYAVPQDSGCYNEEESDEDSAEGARCCA